jgi:hypothetical protein
MLMKIILWFLSLFGYRKEAAAVEAYQSEAQKEHDEAQAKIDSQALEIDHATTQQQAEVDTLPDDALNDRIDELCGTASAHNQRLDK